jgi:hypothetical protein
MLFQSNVYVLIASLNGYFSMFWEKAILEVCDFSNKYSTAL